jgi:SAM-dependent methyltransferase
VKHQSERNVPDDSRRQEARAIAHTHLESGDATGWFEHLYAKAKTGDVVIPWGDLLPNPNFTAWSRDRKLNGSGRKAVKIGCGLGDDAEELARLGFDVTAFDISPTAVAWCHERFPESRVQYHVVDLFKLPKSWLQTFDFVLESYTLQVLPIELRASAVPAIAQLVAPGGTLLLICRGRDLSDDPGKMPWPVVKSELQFSSHDLKEVRFEDYADNEKPPVRRFRVEYRASTR